MISEAKKKNQQQQQQRRENLFQSAMTTISARSAPQTHRGVGELAYRSTLVTCMPSTKLAECFIFFT